MLYCNMFYYSSISYHTHTINNLLRPPEAITRTDAILAAIDM